MGRDDECSTRSVTVRAGDSLTLSVCGCINVKTYPPKPAFLHDGMKKVFFKGSCYQ